MQRQCAGLRPTWGCCCSTRCCWRRGAACSRRRWPPRAAARLCALRARPPIRSRGVWHAVGRCLALRSLAGWCPSKELLAGAAWLHGLSSRRCLALEPPDRGAPGSVLSPEPRQPHQAVAIPALRRAQLAPFGAAQPRSRRASCVPRSACQAFVGRTPWRLTLASGGAAWPHEPAEIRYRPNLGNRMKPDQAAAASVPLRATRRAIRRRSAGRALEAGAVLDRPAPVVALLRAHGRREDQRQAQRAVEGHLAGLGPQDVGLGEQRVTGAEVVVAMLSAAARRAHRRARPGPRARPAP